MAYVFVGDSDIAVTSKNAADVVMTIGVKQAAENYGVSEGKLRAFLNANGWRGVRQTTWEKQSVAGGPPLDVAATPQVPEVENEEPAAF